MVKLDHLIFLNFTSVINHGCEMKSRIVLQLLFFLLLPTLLVLSASAWPSEYETSLKEEAFAILEAKCNVCHRRQKPFMVFKLNNMDKRAPRIYQAVFVQKSMPKGEDIRLTTEEYDKLEEWLKTKINN